MAKVNLRVATLKHGNMKNCDLRGAVLAGADLEVFDACPNTEPNIQIIYQCIFHFNSEIFSILLLVLQHVR